MKRTLRSSHFELVDEDAAWRGYWGKHLHSTQYKTLTYWQRVSVCGGFGDEFRV